MHLVSEAGDLFARPLLALYRKEKSRDGFGSEAKIIKTFKFKKGWKDSQSSLLMVSILENSPICPNLLVMAT